jgi:hypothetical protein
MHQEPLLAPLNSVGSRYLDEENDGLDGPDENDLKKNFEEFFEDALPEFESVGKVVQFKVSILSKN